MARLDFPGLEGTDAVLESEIRIRLDDVEAALAKAVLADSELLAQTSGYLLSAGGKRFRPMLVLLSGYFGDPADQRLVPGSVAIELTHLATLYHDDVIDEADSRRGIPSVNTRWTNTVAILTGDYLFARASEISSDLGTDVTRLLARTIATVCDGQVREVSAAGRTDQTVESYLGTIQRKTASLIATSCRLGGMLSGVPEGYLDTLEEYGDAVGMAFQLSDDVMDFVATAEQLGKEPGIDMREGVYTLPVLYALTGGPRKEELQSLLSMGAPDGRALERALAVVLGDSAIDQAREVVSEHVNRARKLAATLPEGPAAQAMGRLATFLSTRCGASG
ncbi:MAG: polyprenyl synthetase family protein [Actinomycetota bacterium]